MKCEGCGAVNSEGIRFCGYCGRPLAVPPAGLADTKSRNCVECGRPIGWDAFLCMYCGHDYRGKPKRGTEGYLLTGSILTLLAGIMGIALLLTTFSGSNFNSLWSNSLYVLSLSCSFVGVIGGFAALNRKWFPIAILGAAAAIFTPAFFFAVPGLILIANSATRFKDYKDLR
jgi:hypothetical protein